MPPSSKANPSGRSNVIQRFDSYHLITIPTGWFFTGHGFSADPSRALRADRWVLEREQMRLKLPTEIIPAPPYNQQL